VILFAAIVAGEFGFEVVEGGADHVHEIEAAGGGITHGKDGFAFGVVVGDDEGLAVGAEAMGGPFDEVVGGVAWWGEEDFDGGGGLGSVGAWGSASAVEDDGDRGAGGVLVTGEEVDEFLAGGGGVAWFARGDFRAAMEEAVAIDEDTDQSHGVNGSGLRWFLQLECGQFWWRARWFDSGVGMGRMAG
jgi:hypothetical protein